MTAPESAFANPIQVENARAGTSDWATLELKDRAIEGYASEVSALPGDTVSLHVSTSPQAPYRILVYRLGWYQGLGGRLVTCLPSCDGEEAGSAQPQPVPDPATGLTRAGWPVTDQFQVGRDWTSGYYQIRLLLTGGPDEGRSIGFALIVRQPPSESPSSILVQVPVNTWEAYNPWGGQSLYDYNSAGGHAAVKVSFDRPWADAQRQWNWEYNLVRFLEHEGYDVSYTTDVDTDRQPSELLDHSLVLVNGHDEYWSKTIRDAFESARDAGVDLAFFGSDIADWQIRYEDDRRTIVEYRKAKTDPEPDPLLKTDHFALLTPPRPQCSLLGVQYTGRATSQDYAPVSKSLRDPWFDQTGFAAGSIVHGVVGYEQDGIQPGCAIATAADGDLTPLFHYEDPVGSADGDAVAYTAPSGAEVFSTGTLQWSWALDDWAHPGFADARLQRFSENVLNDLGGAPPLPDTEIDSGPARPTNDRSPSFSFSSPWAVGFDCRLGSADWSPCTSPQQFENLADGAYLFEVRGADAAGRLDPSPASAKFTVDTTPPALVLTGHPKRMVRSARRARRVSFDFQADERVALSCQIDGSQSTPCSSPYAVRVRAGTHTFRLSASDAAGNVRTASYRFRVIRER